MMRNMRSCTLQCKRGRTDNRIGLRDCSEEDVKIEELHLAVFEDATTIESGVCESLTMWTSRREEGLEERNMSAWIQRV